MTNNQSNVNHRELARRYALLSALLSLAAAVLGVSWWVVCIVANIGMLINGPYLIAVLCALFAVAFAWASVRAERIDRITARARHLALQRAVQHGHLRINEARAIMGVPPHSEEKGKQL